MISIRESSWDEVLTKMVEWGNHPKSNERRYIPKGLISKSEFLDIRSYTLQHLPVEDLIWTVAEIEDRDIIKISYMRCVEWASLKMLETLASEKIEEIQDSEPAQEIGVLVRGDKKQWHIILDGCHRMSAAHLKGSLIGRKVFIGEGVITDWAKRWQ